MGQRITTVVANGPPPEAACTLYPGEVMHARLKGPLNRFAYKVFSILVDIDRLAEADRITPIFSVDRANLASFHARDHVEREGETVRAYADRLLAEAGVERPGRVLLLCYPRIFGYVFNPISVYYCYDGEGALTALIYAVRNTFGERHAYVAPVMPGEAGPEGIRQARTKIFHVSPFIDLGSRYHFRVLPPGRVARLRIHETEAGAPLLSATFVGEAREMTTAALASCLLKFPLLTWKIMVAIHWEALKLWLRGARFYRSPPPPKPASYRDEGQALEPGE